MVKAGGASIRVAGRWPTGAARRFASRRRGVQAAASADGAGEERQTSPRRSGQRGANERRVRRSVVVDADGFPPPRAATRLGGIGIIARVVAGVVAAACFFISRPATAMMSVRRAAAEPATAAAAAAATHASGAADPTAAALVGATVALLLALAFFSISETAITTLWPWKVREISDQEGPDSSFTLLRKDINRFLTTILIGSTCTGIGSATLATEAAMRLYGESSTAMVAVGLTLVTLVLCEIAPKSIAVQHATAVARVVIRPIAMLSYIVYPVGKICTAMVNAVFAMLNIKGSAEPFVSEEELKLVLSGAAKSGQVDLSEQEMIQNVLEMRETPVREVMTPLVRVVGVEQNASLLDLQEIWRTHRYTRVPVYKERVDNIVGVVYSMRLLDYSLDKDIVSKVSLENLTQRPPFYVPESMSVVKLMREFLARKTHMCIVVNEYGGTVGIATLEDCVEEIVGEIYDETDENLGSNTSNYVTEVAPDIYEVDYRATVDALADAIGVNIPSSALYDTVGGFTCDCFDKIPSVGESIMVQLEARSGYDDDEVNVDKDGKVAEEDQGPACLVRPVRLTVLSGGMKMVKAVQVRVNEAAKLTEIEQEQAARGEGEGSARHGGEVNGAPGEEEKKSEPPVPGPQKGTQIETWTPSR